MPLISFGPFSEGLNKTASNVAKPLSALDDAVNALIDPIGDISSAYESFEFIQFPGPVFDVPTRIIYWPEKDVYTRLNGKSRDGSNGVVFQAGKGFLTAPIATSESTATIYEELLVVAVDADVDYPTRVYGTNAEAGLFIPISENFKSAGTISSVSGFDITGLGTSFDVSDIGKRFYFQTFAKAPSLSTISYVIVGVAGPTSITVNRNVENDLIAAGFTGGSPPSLYRIALDGFRGISPEVYKGRIFFIDGENQTTIVHTGFPGDAGGPPQLFDFSFIDPLTRIELGNSFGKLVGLKAAGSALYAIAERGAFIITGTPPVNPALGNSLRPEPMAKSVGAKGYDAIAITRDGQGLLLSSEAGFWTIYGTRSSRIDDQFRGHEYFDPSQVTHVASDQRRAYFSISTHDWKRPLVDYKRITSQEPLSFFIDQREGSASVIQRTQTKDGEIQSMSMPGFNSAIMQANGTRSTEVFVSSDRRIVRINFDNEPEPRREYGTSFITTHSDGRRPGPKRIWNTHVQVQEPGIEKLSVIAPAAGKSGFTPTEEKTISRTSFDADASRFTAFGGQGKGTSHISVGIGHFSDIVYGGTDSDDLRDTLSAAATASDDWYISPFTFICDTRKESTFINRIDLLISSNDITEDIDGLELAIIQDDGTTVSLTQKASIKEIFSATQLFSDGFQWVWAYIDPVIEINHSTVQYYVGCRWDAGTVDLPLEFGNSQQVETFNETTGITGVVGPTNRRFKFRAVRQVGRPYLCRNLSMVVADVEPRPGVQI